MISPQKFPIVLLNSRGKIFEVFLFDFISKECQFWLYYCRKWRFHSFLPKSSLEACNYIRFPLYYENPCPKEFIKPYKPKIWGVSVRLYKQRMSILAILLLKVYIFFHFWPKTLLKACNYILFSSWLWRPMP